MQKEARDFLKQEIQRSSDNTKLLTEKQESETSGSLHRPMTTPREKNRTVRKVRAGGGKTSNRSKDRIDQFRRKKQVCLVSCFSLGFSDGGQDRWRG